MIADRGAEVRRRIRRPCGRDVRRGGGGRARPDAVDRAHPEPVGLAVGQVEHGVAGGCPARGDPGAGTALLVLVAGDRLPAVGRGRRPDQIHPLVAARGAEVRRRAGHRGRGDARRGGGGRARPGAVDRPHPERVGLTVGQAGHRVAGGCAARGDPGPGKVLLVFVVRDLRAAGGLDPTEHHLPVAGHGAEARRHVGRPQRAGLPRTGRRPGAVAFGVSRQHLHLVGGALGQAPDGGAGAAHVLGAVGPAPAGAFPVLQVVVVDGGTGVRRCRPVHRQAVRRARRRGHRGGRGPVRRLLHVGDRDRHREGVAAAVVVVGLQRHRVARLRLVVVGHAGLRRELPGRRVEAERCRVCALQRVGQRVVVRIRRRRQRRADVRVRRRVLGHLARGRGRGEFRRLVGDDRVGHGGRCQGEVGVAGSVLDGEGGERHGEVRGRGCQGRRQGEFDLGCSRACRGRRQGDAVGLDGDVGSKDRAEEGLAERQDHFRAVGRRRRRIAAGGDERRADAVDLVPGVDHHRGVGEVGADGRAAGGRDGAAGELVRPDRDAAGSHVAHAHRVAAPHRGRVRGGRAGGRFRGAGKVQLQLRGAGDVDRRAEGHRRLDRFVDAVGGGGVGGGQRDRRDVRAVDRQRQADGVPLAQVGTLVVQRNEY